jgi:hypothetical protein
MVMDQGKFSHSRVGTGPSGGDWHGRLVKAPIGKQTEHSRTGGGADREAIETQPGWRQNADWWATEMSIAA